MKKRTMRKCPHCGKFFALTPTKEEMKKMQEELERKFSADTEKVFDLVEQVKTENAALSEENAALRKEKESLDAHVQMLKNKGLELLKHIDRLESRNWWQRLLNKM